MRSQQLFALSAFLVAQTLNPLFGAPVTFAARQALELSSPVLTVADINKDGHNDIISAVSGSVAGDYQVSIQLGSSNGTFTQGPIIDLGNGFIPTAIATGDFNNDGLLDIAVLSSAQHALYIVTQQFQGFGITPIQIAEDTSQTLNMAVGDLNGDRLPDIIIPSAAGTIVLLSAGGHLQTPILASSSSSTFVAAADLNNDKKLDLVVSANSCCFGSSILVLLGDGHGGFDAPLSQPSFGTLLPRFTLADLNKDGRVDLAALSPYYPGTVVTAFGNGDGTFAASNSFSIPSATPTPLAIVSGDLNGDNVPDLVVIATGSFVATNLIVFLNGGKGTFGPANVYPVQLSANVVTLANLNADTYLDALTYTNGQGSVISLLFNSGNGALIDGEFLPTAHSPQYLVSGDFNGDRKLDLATLNNIDGLTLFLNNGNNKDLFTPEASLPYYSGPIIAGDFNNDRREDLVILNNGNGQTLLGNGDGTFSLVPSSFSTGPFSISSAITADMNGDGKLDLVTDAPTVNLGNGDGTFQPPFTQVGNFCFGANVVAVADFNRDGRPDVATTCNQDLFIYLGNGDGTLGYATFSEYLPDLISLTVGDFNHDGIPDVAFTSFPNYFLPNSTTVSILIGQGNGYFTPGISIPVLTGQSGQIIAGEFDGNGVTDLAIVDDTDAVVSILRGNGDGTFQIPELYGAASAPSCVVAGRFRSGSQPGEQDLAFCAGQGIGLDLNTTK